MSASSTHTMTPGHHFDLSHAFATISETLRIWRQRYVYRQELARLSDQDFHDVGASWSDFADEASKPFWRA